MSRIHILFIMHLTYDSRGSDKIVSTVMYSLAKFILINKAVGAKVMKFNMVEKIISNGPQIQVCLKAVN